MDVVEARKTIKVSDAALLDDLQSVTDAVELTTPEGKVIGTFKPAAGAFHPRFQITPFTRRDRRTNQDL